MRIIENRNFRSPFDFCETRYDRIRFIFCISSDFKKGRMQ